MEWMEEKAPVLVNVNNHDIGRLVAAYARAEGMMFPSEDEIHEASCGTGHPWMAWYVRGLEAVRHDDLEELNEAVDRMNHIYVKMMEDDADGKA